jgi:Carboxypeptidase regulatory-like domain/TonB dependent receptor-like, beta-barrel
MRSFLLAVCCFAIGLNAIAQTDRGTITGTITDPAGAVIASAAVEAKNTATGAVYQAGSSGTGNYTLAQLPAGTYDLTVTVQGFKKFVRTGILVQVAQTARIDAALEVGAATESITVNEAAPLLKTESGELSHNISYDRIDSLPLLTLSGSGAGLGNIRNPLAAVTLLPGAAFATDNTLRINGMPSSSQAIRIEGQDATNGMWRQLTQVNQAGVDAIQEVAVQTSNFAAEYGQAGGGYFNYTMKSGTNQFHGSGYDYLNNDVLNAGTPFTNDGTGQHIRNALNRNDYGFTFGGPVWLPHLYNGHDKTFFFFSFEQFRENQTISTGLATVPTPAYTTGDFSKAVFPVPLPPDPLGRSFLTQTVMDPNTTREENGAVVRDPFPNGQVPMTRFDPVAVKLQALIPMPNAPGSLNNYVVPAYDNYRHTTIPSIKIDHSLNDKIKLSGYFSVTHTASPNANGFPATLAPVAPQDDTAYTTRINYDHTLRPTLLLHLGIGLLYINHPTISPNYDQSQLWAPNEQFNANNYMPSIGGLSSFFTGGLALGSGFFAPGIGVGAFSDIQLKDIKPTSNASLTWVKGNHTFKFGGELIVEGFPQQSSSRANGIYGFSAQQTSNPWENGQPTGGLNTGFPYASFLLGLSNSLQVSDLTDTRLGNHSLGLYAQDSWKVTRKLTLDYGLRYDYVTLLKEQYGRMQNAAFDLPNAAVGGRLGTVIYEGNGGGRCNCSFNHNYPWAFGPRLGVAYQITSKTVFRAGTGISYGSAPNNAFLSYSVADFYTVGPSGYGLAATQLAQGSPYAPGNVFGNPTIHFPDFSPHYPTQVAPGIIPPQSPFISIDRNAGRPPRIFQWSIGLQQQLASNLVVEASYVGNRGAWWTAPLLETYSYNALTPQGLLKNFGLDITNANDRNLLSLPISNPAVIARFPSLANPNSVYPGFPSSQTLTQALVPYPQWNGIPPFLGPPLGDTWYDSLQAKVTKRYSHGLDVQAAFTWQKELTNGANSDTSYLTPNAPRINDVFNYRQNKQISGFSRPFVFVLSFDYTTPKFNADSAGMKTLSWVTRDWTLGGVLVYQSGMILQSPPSNNQLLAQLGRGPANNPALWGGGATFYNRVPGQPLFVSGVDPNCKCFDPTQQLTLNPKAWVDAAPGQFGTAAPYYNDFRWQRQPAESLSFGRIFRIKERMSLQARVEFQNIFNRLFLSAPVIGGFGGATPATPQANNNPGGALSAGWGYVNTTQGLGSRPRTGQLVIRFQF